VRRRELERIARLEASGEMDRRRAELRGWFTAHPDGSTRQALSELGCAGGPDYLDDYMDVVADSVKIDLRREREAGGGDGRAQAAGTQGLTGSECGQPGRAGRAGGTGPRNAAPHPAAGEAGPQDRSVFPAEAVT
jgi:hypothetical protein